MHIINRCNFSGEPNPYCVIELIAVPKLCMLELDIKSRNVTMKILGDNGLVLQELKQSDLTLQD